MRDVSKWLALIALAVLLWFARGALTPFIIAGILAYILSPLADVLAQRTGWARTPAALLVFFCVVALFGFGVAVLGTRVVREALAFGQQSPNIADTIAQKLTGGKTIDVVGTEFAPHDLADRVNAALADTFGDPAEALHAAKLALERTLDVVLTLLTLAYLLVDGHRLGPFLLRFVPSEHHQDVERVTAEIHVVLGRYLRGQLFLIALVSVVTYIFLEWVFQLPYALPIALATGVLEIIPLIGPFIAAGIACAVGVAQGGLREAGMLALLYLAIRQVEDQLVMPNVVGHAVHVHPLVTLFAVVVGGHIAGVLGTLLAVPIAAATKVVLDFAYPPVRPEQEDSRHAGSAVALLRRLRRHRRPPLVPEPQPSAAEAPATRR